MTLTRQGTGIAAELDPPSNPVTFQPAISDVLPKPITLESHRTKLASTKTPDQRGEVGAGSPNQTPGRKRDASLAGLDSSPGSVESPDLHDGEDGHSRKRPAKRACNECRQQKLRCDVVQKPFKVCSRCSRLHLECKIEDNFKRVGKRSRNAEMEREIVELRKQVAAQTTNSSQTSTPGLNIPRSSKHAYTDDAVAGLLDLRGGYEKSPGGAGMFKRLEDVALNYNRVKELFQRFFRFNHEFLPFLNKERTPEEYYKQSPLLFWTIILVGARHYTSEPNLFGALSGPLQRLLWSTIAEVPQTYHVVKALIVLCAWPLPTSSTTSDPTFMLCGMMMQIALQIGLHRPDHAQDFSKFRVELRQAELQDRVVVWSVCNIVAQRIATAYGQPALTIYDWTLSPQPIKSNPSYEMPPEIFNRLQIEKFNDTVSKTVYSNPKDPVGLPEDYQRSQLVRVLTQDLEELEGKLLTDLSPITNIHLKAAALHLHLSALFSHRDLPSYRTDMLKLYNATIAFLEVCLSLESSYSINMPSNYSQGLSLTHATNYLFHMMLAAAFSLIKLVHHFLPQHDLDSSGADELLTRTLWALRTSSVVENDLPERLAEVVAQVWKSTPRRPTQSDPGNFEEPSDELQLKVRCRMSMSLVYDSLWRWRRNFRDLRPPPARLLNPNGQPSNTEPINNNNTNNVLVNTTGANEIPTDPSLEGAAAPVPGMAGMPTGMADDFGTDYRQANYEVFDPLNWMLDGLVDFPYNFNNVGSMEQSNMNVLDNSGI